MRTKMDDHRDADPLVDNYRPTQSLHGRKIHARSTLAKLRAITSNVSSSPGVPRVSMATIVMTFLIFGLTTC